MEAKVNRRAAVVSALAAAAAVVVRPAKAEAKPETKTKEEDIESSLIPSEEHLQRWKESMRPAAERFAKRVAPIYKMLNHKWAVPDHNGRYVNEFGQVFLAVPMQCQIHAETLRLINSIKSKNFQDGAAYIATGGIVVTAFINECDEIDGEIKYETCNEICCTT